MNSLFFSFPGVVLVCVCMHTHMHCLLYEQYMTVYEEFTSNLLAYTHHFEQEALLGSTPGSYYLTPPFFHVLCSSKGLWKIVSIITILNWWCYAFQATNIITNPQTNIGARCSFHCVVVMMLLWLLMGSPAKVEN